MVELSSKYAPYGNIASGCLTIRAFSISIPYEFLDKDWIGDHPAFRFYYDDGLQRRLTTRKAIELAQLRHIKLVVLGRAQQKAIGLLLQDIGDGRYKRLGSWTFVFQIPDYMYNRCFDAEDNLFEIV